MLKFRYPIQIKRKRDSHMDILNTISLESNKQIKKNLMEAIFLRCWYSPVQRIPVQDWGPKASESTL